MSANSHEWNMIIFIARDEKKFILYRKKLEFSVYYILSVILNNSVVIETWWLLYIIFTELEESSPAGDQRKCGKYVLLRWKITVYSENTENENYTHFIPSIFLNISFISI